MLNKLQLNNFGDSTVELIKGKKIKSSLILYTSGIRKFIILQENSSSL